VTISGEESMHRPLLWRVLSSILATLGTVVALANAAAARSIELRDDLGGNIYSYEAKFRAIARAGDEVRIGGTCASACTFVLIYVPKKQVCLEPDTKFAFHSVSSGRAGNPLDDLASLEIFISYPSWVQDEITSFSGKWDGGGNLPPSNTLLVVKGDYFLWHGYKACDDAKESVASMPDPAPTVPDAATLTAQQ
jgi:hypothetical protein